MMRVCTVSAVLWCILSAACVNAQDRPALAEDTSTSTTAIVTQSVPLRITGRQVTRERLLAALPNWMTYLWPSIRNVPLNNLWMPGSHDTFTYDLGHFASSDTCVTVLASLAAKNIKQWAVAQPLDVVQQLNMGVRYLDVRPYYISEVNDIFAQHCLITNKPLGSYYNDIRQNWLEPQRAAGSKEVVIMHFKDFKGTWDANSFNLLFTQLANIFRGFIATGVTPDSTLADIMAANSNGPKVVFVMETPNNELAFSLQSSNVAIDFGTFMWRPYPDVDTTPALLQAGDRNIKNRPANVTMVLEGVLTPTATDVAPFLSPDGSSKTLSLLLYWEQGVWSTTNRLLPYMYYNWLDAPGMIIMLDNPHPQDAVAIIGANFKQAQSRFAPQAFSYGACSSKYRFLSGCVANWNQCASGYSPEYLLGGQSVSCMCSCCKGGDTDSDCGFAAGQFVWK